MGRPVPSRDPGSMRAIAAPSVASPHAGDRASLFASPSLVLFLAIFASQAGVLVLSPILSDVAAEFGVSVAAAGQLRILAAPLAAVVAIAAGRALVRFSPRALLAAGTAFLAAGSVASAAAPTFALLALAQVPVWTGVAILMTAGVAATAAWSAPEDRTKIVARALAGAPAAWIVGMPMIGLVAEVDWRLAFLALPLPAAIVAGVAVARRPSDVPIPGARASLLRVLSQRDARGWAVGEFFATSAWAGTLVFSGALFTEVHGTSPAATGLALALVAAAYLAGNQWAGRSDSGRARRTMLTGTTAAAAAVALTWAIAPTVVVTLVLFSVAAFVVATRTVAATVYGFSVAGGHGREVGTIRAATSDLAYLVGSVVGGAALAVGGFPALAIAMGGLFVAATLPYVRVRGSRRARPALQPAS
jgi:predicted MFS family arabinose efflux permease